MAVWNGLVSRRLISGEQVAPGRIQTTVQGQGFNWNVHAMDGVTVEPLENRRGMRLVFSRSETEYCLILGQWDRAVALPEISLPGDIFC